MRPTLEDEWDLEPWDDDPDGVDAHNARLPVGFRGYDRGRTDAYLKRAAKALRTS
jgi:hypothetical protein